MCWWYILYIYSRHARVQAQKDPTYPAFHIPVHLIHKQLLFCRKRQERQERPSRITNYSELWQILCHFGVKPVYWRMFGQTFWIHVCSWWSSPCDIFIVMKFWAHVVPCVWEKKSFWKVRMFLNNLLWEQMFKDKSVNSVITFVTLFVKSLEIFMAVIRRLFENESAL